MGGHFDFWPRSRQDRKHAVDTQEEPVSPAWGGYAPGICTTACPAGHSINSRLSSGTSSSVDSSSPHTISTDGTAKPSGQSWNPAVLELCFHEPKVI